MTTATAAESARTAGRPLAGWICAAGGVVGVASGLVTAFVPQAVTRDMYRYPFSPGAYTAAQSSTPPTTSCCSPACSVPAGSGPRAAHRG